MLDKRCPDAIGRSEKVKGENCLKEPLPEVKLHLATTVRTILSMRAVETQGEYL